MKQLNLLIFLIFVFINYGTSQNINLDWAIGFGGSSSDYGYHLTIDINNNTYVTGGFQGTVDFDPGSGTAMKTSNGSNDIFLAKYDSLGNFIWALNVGGSSNDLGYNLKTDSNSNIYLIGWFQGTVDFDPGSGTAMKTSNGSNDIFIAKYNSSGNFIWANSMGASSDDRATALILDMNTNIFLVGSFQGTTDFNPGSGVANLTSNGNSDIYIAKYDLNGNYLWAKGIGGTGADGVYDVDLDAIGNPYLIGYFESTVDFNPGTGISNITSSGARDIFFSKYDNNGNYLWANKLSGTDGSLGASIAVNQAGNSYLTGSYFATIDMDPGTGTSNLTYIGGHDIYIAKYDTYGSYIWAKSMGGTSYDRGIDICLDTIGSIFITGYYQGTADFDPDSGVSNLSSTGNADVYFAKYSNSGSYIWALSIGGVSYDIAQSLEVDVNNNVYVSGAFSATADFDPGSGIYNLTSNGSYDVYVIKLEAIACSPIYGTDVRTECNPYTWLNGITYTSNNNTATFNIVGGATSGCDSLVTLNLTILNQASGTDTRTECGSLTWIDGNTYTSSNNTASFNIVNGAANGCDSLVTLDLTILNHASGTDTKTECDSLTWIDGNTYTASNNTASFNIVNGAANGCDSLVTLDLTIFNPISGTDTRTECDSLIWIDGNTYTSSNNTASFNIVNGAANGCDSLVTLDLTILNPISGTDTRTECDSLIWIDGNTYTASNNTASFNIVNGAANGCDSLVTLDLTILNPTSGTDTRTECDSLIWIDGNTYTASNNTASFNIVNGAANGCDSLVMLDLTILNSATGTDTRTECDSLTWIDGNTYTSSNNTASFNIVNGAANGCDSLVMLDLTILNSATGTDTRTECDSLIWIDGNTYTSSNNTASFNIVNGAANGCDSLVTLDLTILNPTSGTDTRTECDSLTWIDGNTYTSSNNTASFNIVNGAANGCDSLVILDLTILNSAMGTDTRTECDSLTWIDGNTYTSSNNTATFNIVNGAANGCDSLVTLDLTINSVNINTTLNAITISSSASGAAYQWLDCDNVYSIISGEIYSTYTPSSNGNYAVEVTENGCIDTSACVAITTVYIVENLFKQDFIVYPNPNDGNFEIAFEKVQENLTIKLLSMSGQLIEHRYFKNSNYVQLELNQPNGIYLLEISDGNKNKVVIRLVKY